MTPIVLASLLPGVAGAQRIVPSDSSRALAIRWTMPLSHVTPRVPLWNRTDLGLAGGFLTLLWIDASQTRSLARANWEGFTETNPFLGKTPSEGQVNAYTAAAAVTTLGIAAALPSRSRRWWLGAAVAVQAITVYHTSAALRIPISLR